MRCAECLRAIAALPDGNRAELPAEARKHVESCPACARRLAALRLLDEGTPLRVAPPPGLAGSVLVRLDGARRGRARRRRLLRWAPLAAAAVLALTVLTPLVRGPADAGGGRAEGGRVRVHLALVAPSASAVTVVGDWNDWDPHAQPMRRHDGSWEIDLELERGRLYQYQFLVNGDTWIPDPHCLAKVDNGFGGVNSLLGS
jgi:hypothetical protein